MNTSAFRKKEIGKSSSFIKYIYIQIIWEQNRQIIHLYSALFRVSLCKLDFIISIHFCAYFCHSIVHVLRILLFFCHEFLMEHFVCRILIVEIQVLSKYLIYECYTSSLLCAKTNGEFSQWDHNIQEQNLIQDHFAHENTIEFISIPTFSVQGKTSYK